MTMRPGDGAEPAAVKSVAPTAAAPAADQPPPAYVQSSMGVDDGGGDGNGGAAGGGPGAHADGDGGAGVLATYARIVHSDATALAKARLLVDASRQHVQQQFTSLRPWHEFFDRSYLAAPAGVTEAVQRLTRNVGYFYPNYIVLSLLCSSYILLINLAFSLCVVFCVVAYFYIRTLSAAAAARGIGDGQIYLCGRSFTALQLYVMLGLFAAVGFYVTNGSSVIFWLTLMSCGVTATHAILRRPALAEPTFAFA